MTFAAVASAGQSMSHFVQHFGTGYRQDQPGRVPQAEKSLKLRHAQPGGIVMGQQQDPSGQDERQPRGYRPGREAPAAPGLDAIEQRLGIDAAPAHAK